MTQNTTNKPLHRIKSGSLTLAIWNNTGENGPYQTVTMERSYRDGDQWKSTASLRKSDLPHLAYLAQRAALYLETVTAEAPADTGDAEEAAA